MIDELILEQRNLIRYSFHLPSVILFFFFTLDIHNLSSPVLFFLIRSHFFKTIYPHERPENFESPTKLENTKQSTYLFLHLV